MSLPEFESVQLRLREEEVDAIDAYQCSSLQRFGHGIRIGTQSPSAASTQKSADWPPQWF
jgi:hypothetical protein